MKTIKALLHVLNTPLGWLQIGKIRIPFPPLWLYLLSIISVIFFLACKLISILFL